MPMYGNGICRKKNSHMQLPGGKFSLALKIFE
jgi:hypothetical protein